MNRRQILRYTAWITGSAVSASLAGAVLGGCSEAPRGTAAVSSSSLAASTTDTPLLHYFSPDQFQQLGQLVDAILPRTDTPSATDVNVHVTMDSMLGQVMDANYQRQFKDNWLALWKYLGQQNFAGRDADQQAALLSELELNTDAALAKAQRGLVEVKQQTIVYYLVSETIAEEHLNYLPVPGKYEPCISVESVNNKAWAI